MSNSYFQFKQFRIEQRMSGMKVTTDACLFGAWVASQITIKNEPKRILDIGTGTGLLSLMLAQVTTDSQIDAIDINENAFKEASYNFEGSPWSDRLQCFHTSLQSFESTDAYDLIICNPPFFRKNPLGRHTSKNQALHNDDMTMEDLTDGIDRLLTGTAFILYPEWEMKAFTKWMEKKSLLVSDRTEVRNKIGGSVFRVMSGFSKNSETQQHELIIKKEDGSYTEEFMNLLGDYYLKS